MNNYNKHKNIFISQIIRNFGVNRETNLPELCNDMSCEECLFTLSACGTAMKEWLEKDEDKNYTSSFMEKFTRLV